MSRNDDDDTDMIRDGCFLALLGSALIAIGLIIKAYMDARGK